MKLIRYIAAGLLAAGTTLALAQPASATTEPEPICGTWKATEFIGAANNGPAPLNAAVSADGTTVTLERTADDRGMEYLRTGLDLEGPLDISVQVDATDAEAAAGAVRIFGYASDAPDTATTAPDYGAPHDASAVAAGLGPLTLHLDDGEELGSLGFTWDSSNSNFGKVTFGPATIDGRPVSFKACPEPEETASPTAQPTTKAPTTRPTSARPTGTPATLPVTGSGGGLNPLAILLPMGAALVLGGVGFVLMRRRRDNPTFTAE